MSLSISISISIFSEIPILISILIFSRIILSDLDIDISKHFFIDIDTDIDIFKNGLFDIFQNGQIDIDIDIDIFKVSIYRQSICLIDISNTLSWPPTKKCDPHTNSFNPQSKFLILFYVFILPDLYWPHVLPTDLPTHRDTYWTSWYSFHLWQLACPPCCTSNHCNYPILGCNLITFVSRTSTVVT